MGSKQRTLFAATALIVAPLFAAAQAADVTGYKEAEDEDMVVAPLNLTVEDLEDMDVNSADGDEVGEVEEVLVDTTGQPVALVVEVGGFLGIGEREVILGLDQVKVVDDELVTAADKATIEALPDWKD
jgi:sporulation protein YlmC with PRC-barrel domain